MRNAFSESIIRMATADERMILLTGDHGYELFDDFRSKFPSRFINAGIAEQNMIGVAAGLAKSGFRPIVYGLSAFLPIRVLEQIKLDICYEKLPVILIGDGAGVVYSKLGVSHQSTEDISVLRALPNIMVFSPADRFEMTWSMNLAIQNESPSYIRIGKADLGDVHQSPLSNQMGELCELVKGKDVAIIATGSMVIYAKQLAIQLGNMSVYSAPTIKPLDVDGILRVLLDHRIIVTVEEHSIYGGLGSAISEISTTYHPLPICRIGINDVFTDVIGTYDFVLANHGLDLNSMMKKVVEFLNRHHLLPSDREES